MTVKRKRKVETLAGTNYVLRPVYDEMIAEFGSPPRGYPDECKFKWPEKASTTTESESFIYVGDAGKVQLSTKDVTVIEIPNG